MLSEINIKQPKKRLFAGEQIPPFAPIEVVRQAPPPEEQPSTPEQPTDLFGVDIPPPAPKPTRRAYKAILGDISTGHINTNEKIETPTNSTAEPHSDIVPGMHAADKKTDYYANREEGISWAPHIAELKEFYKTAQYDNGIRLDKATVIEDTALFIETNLSIIQAYEGNRNFLPALDRLKKLKRILETKTPA